MKLPKYSHKYKRTIIVLMSINIFALIVNILSINPKITYKNHNFRERDIYLFTDSDSYSSHVDSQKEKQKNFWPFIDFFFISEKPKHLFKYNYNHSKMTSFRGLFVDFDLSEFIIYSMLIFGFQPIKRIWSNDKDIDD